MPLADDLVARGVASELAARLAAYGTLLLEENRRTNLTGAKDEAALLPHLLDALTLVADVTGSLVDVGSGGGLPGIPLALATGAAVTLIEPTEKKAAALRRMAAALDLSAEIVAERAETAGHDPSRRGHFAVATARAVGPAPTVAELTIPLLAIGGRALLQRGRIDERERQALEDAVPVLGARMVEERVLAGERRVFVIEKIAPTGTRFPRRNGVPAKRPLCLDGG